MYKAPKSIQAPKPPKMEYWPERTVPLNGGLNLIEREWKLADNQTSKVLNMWFREGELCKRWGQEYINEALEKPTLTVYKYKYDGKIIFHSDTKLYTMDDEGTISEIYGCNC